MVRRRTTVWVGIILATGLLAVSLAEAQRSGRNRKRRQPGSRAETRRPGGSRTQDRLKVGDKAPDFTLKTLDGKKQVTLSRFQGKQPVLLVFGSYT